MKERLHRVFSCLMALLLLASTVSWTVGKHYCMGHLIDVSLFSHAEDCGMDLKDSNNDTTTIMDENSCCDDELLIFEGQDDLKVSFNDFSIDQEVFWVAFAHSYLYLFQVQEEPKDPIEQYPPPILVKDIQLLDEVFII